MKYTLEQRLDIGRRIYEGELTRFQAAEEYGIDSNPEADTRHHVSGLPLTFSRKETLQ